MGNLVFPQLATGALAQFPIRKTRIARTVKNVLPDGSVIAYPDPDAARLSWQLVYVALSSADLSALTTHFAACQGRLHDFTFIDPTDNMLNSSSSLQAPQWQMPPGISLTPQTADPNGANEAFTLTNTSQVAASISQTLNVPANYQYCFSVFATSAAASTITLIRSGPVAHDSVSVPISSQWSRVTSSGRLSDTGQTFTVAIQLEPGQQVSLYGPQLEAQITPSRYCPTATTGGVYADAHWGVDELLTSADGPDLFSTAFAIETAL